MTRRLRSVFVVFAACAAMWHLPACQSPDRTQETLLFLQRGEARGHLSVATDGQLTVGSATELYLGARRTTIAFDGDIDFSKARDGGTEARRDEGKAVGSEVPTRSPDGGG